MLIQKYKESWIEDFNHIKQVISEALKNQNTIIEHVGSTSVPYLDAKPIIDMDIVFDENTTFESIKIALGSIGYFHNGNQGIVNREVFKRKSDTKHHEILDVITHHLYVCPSYSEELQRHILFRDYLRKNENARLEYQRIKYETAEETQQDKKKYAVLKEIKTKDFVQEIIDKQLFEKKSLEKAKKNDV